MKIGLYPPGTQPVRLNTQGSLPTQITDVEHINNGPFSINNLTNVNIDGQSWAPFTLNLAQHQSLVAYLQKYPLNTVQFDLNQANKLYNNTKIVQSTSISIIWCIQIAQAVEITRYVDIDPVIKVLDASDYVISTWYSPTMVSSNVNEFGELRYGHKPSGGALYNEWTYYTLPEHPTSPYRVTYYNMNMNGYSWFRLYKSGWVEQGGYIVCDKNDTSRQATVTLPVEMYNNTYSIILQHPSSDRRTYTEILAGVQPQSPYVGAGGSYQAGYFQPHNTTQTGFTILVYPADENNKMEWTVRGRSKYWPNALSVLYPDVDFPGILSNVEVVENKYY